MTAPDCMRLIVAATCACLLGCTDKPIEETQGVLARVNGVPVTQEDIALASRGAGGHSTDMPAADKKEILEKIIRQELLRQRAVSLGLDADPAYQQELRVLEAQVADFKRKKLSEIFSQREITQKAVVNDAEMRAYFDDNAEQLRTETHVWQILRRNRDEIEGIRDQLARGQSFEEVAARQFQDLPDLDRKPWDLGYLRWQQVPEAWKSIIDEMDIGATSDIITGPNRRFWIIKLVDRRENTDITFEQVQPVLAAMLKNRKSERLREQIQQDLRAGAHIEYLN